MFNILILCDNHILNLEGVVSCDFGSVYQYPIYKKCNLFLRIFRRIHLASTFPLKSIWYSAWLNNNSTDYDIIILFDSILSEDVLNKVQHKFINSRLIFWYWNLIKKNTIPESIRKYNFELWTFDYLESNKFQLKLNTQFYYPRTFNKKTIKTDVFFIGRNFNRINRILELESIFENSNLTCNFIIVKSNASSLFNKKHKREVSSIISYDKVLEYISESLCLLELNQFGQVGLTVRALESIFYSKKLITDNIDVEKFDFYRKENIFILGKDNLEDLYDFVKLPYMEIDNEIIINYTLNSWINGFIENH